MQEAMCAIGIIILIIGVFLLIRSFWGGKKKKAKCTEIGGDFYFAYYKRNNKGEKNAIQRT